MVQYTRKASSWRSLQLYILIKKEFVKHQAIYRQNKAAMSQEENNRSRKFLKNTPKRKKLYGKKNSLLSSHLLGSSTQHHKDVIQCQSWPNIILMDNVCDDASFWQLGIGELAAKEPFPPTSSLPHILPPMEGKRRVGMQKQESFFFFLLPFLSCTFRRHQVWKMSEWNL